MNAINYTGCGAFKKNCIRRENIGYANRRLAFDATENMAKTNSFSFILYHYVFGCVILSLSLSPRLSFVHTLWRTFVTF